MTSRVAAARYGKENVRVYKVHRDEAAGTQTVVEMTVCVLLEGEIDVSYTKADNSVVVATDSIKNTIYILAKQNPVTPPELFASIVGDHFINKYKHIHIAHVNVVAQRWSRVNINGKPHPHSFLKDASEVRSTDVTVTEGKGVDIKTSLSGLSVLKSTNSQFHGFVRDEFTTLPETWDRVLSTDVDSTWTWSTFSSVEQVRRSATKFDTTWDTSRGIILETFSNDNSASVQNTMYKMGERFLAAQPLLETAEFSLPNKHYFQLDLSWHKGLKNTGTDAEVYVPGSGASGLIKCTIGRGDVEKKSKL
ncbi:uricase [Arthroderma uncinatum]|uniref:uricase n=1 Tax=Arthroderma uncinatum TaxID=74035 RepID=UPI00144AD1CA|nr:uricase [Arthroderma uncinatum]KAF3491088.1 uricase [Arthroderma uncinatum]